MKDFIGKDYAHAQKVFQELKLKILGDYHDFYVQSHTLLLADVFENFRNKCIEIYKLDPAHSVSAWQACFKKVEAVLELLTNNGMLLMDQKGTRDAICQVIHRYAKANKQIIWMGNVSKTSCKRFQIGRISSLI